MGIDAAFNHSQKLELNYVNKKNITIIEYNFTRMLYDRQ